MADTKRQGKLNGCDDVYNALKCSIQSMKADSRLPSERKLSEDLSLSRATIHKSLSILTAEGFVYRKHGSGTYVSGRKKKEGEKIFLLLPCPSFLSLDAQTSVTGRQILQGIQDELFGTGISVEIIPVTRDNNPEHINWAALKNIPPKGNVFILCHWWYKDLLSFFEKSEYNIVLDDHQRYMGVVNLPSAYLLVCDFEGANESAVKTLLERGKNRPALLHFVGIRPDEDLNEPQLPGYLRGIEKYGSSSTEKLVLKIIYELKNQREAFARLPNELAEYWHRTKYDSLIVPWDTCLPVVLDGIRKLGLKIPEDMAIICTRDYQDFHKTVPSISGYAIPGVTLGREVARVFAGDTFHPGGRTVLKLDWTERESTGRVEKNNPDQRYALLDNW